jgi:hypothetical protein
MVFGDSFDEFFEESWDDMMNVAYEDENGVRVPTKKKRISRGRVNEQMLGQSIWGQLIRHPNVNNPNSYEGKKFGSHYSPLYIAAPHNLSIPHCFIIIESGSYISD